MAIYALHSLGTETIYPFNGTKATAAALAHEFLHMGIHVIDTVAGWPKRALAPRIIVSTVPDMTTDARSESGAVVTPEAMFAYREGTAVFVDMAYKLSATPLIKLGCDIENWTPVPGLAVLLKQGYRQFELWTGRRCPQVAVAEKAWTRYEKI